MQCPKCGASGPDGSETCLRCGLVFARYDPAAQARIAAERRAEREARAAEASRLRRVLVATAAIALAAVAVAVWWNGRPTPQDFAPPVGRAFIGQAHEYAGAGADLVLAGFEENAAVVIGRIDADGTFRFELPETMDVARIPTVERLPPDAKVRSDDERAAIEKQFAERAAAYDTAFGAVRRLAAGLAWTELDVQPDDLNVARYAVEYRAPGEFGVLMASNSDMTGIALPGDHVLTLVYADRAGTVRGTAVAENAFGVEAPNAWDLTLQPGWNLVTSEQTENLARIAYRSGPVPDDLAWYAIDPETRKVSLF